MHKIKVEECNTSDENTQMEQTPEQRIAEMQDAVKILEAQGAALFVDEIAVIKQKIAGLVEQMKKEAEEEAQKIASEVELEAAKLIEQEAVGFWQQYGNAIGFVAAIGTLVLIVAKLFGLF